MLRDGKAPRPSFADAIASADENRFDVLRLIAAGLVIFGHSFALAKPDPALPEPLTLLTGYTYTGHVGVEIFFFVSGLFVTQSLLRTRAFTAFALRRVLRIWPGLVVCLLVTTPLALAVSGINPLTGIVSPDALAYMTRNALLRTTYDIPGVFTNNPLTAINGSLWTLPIEVKLYAIVLVLGIVGRRPWRVMFLAAVLTLAAAALVVPVTLAPLFDVAHPKTVTLIVLFLAGAASYVLRAWIAVRGWHVLLAVALLAALPFAAAALLYPVVVVLAAIWFGTSPVTATIPPLRADYSYGTYIYAFPVQQGIIALVPDIGPYTLAVASVVAVAPFAWASWHGIEKHAQRFGAMLSDRLSPPSVPSGPNDPAASRAPPDRAPAASVR